MFVVWKRMGTRGEKVNRNNEIGAKRQKREKARERSRMNNIKNNARATHQRGEPVHFFETFYLYLSVYEYASSFLLWPISVCDPN